MLEESEMIFFGEGFSRKSVFRGLLFFGGGCAIFGGQNNGSPYQNIGSTSKKVYPLAGSKFLGTFRKLVSFRTM